jgi:hypothetical protein
VCEEELLPVDSCGQAEVEPESELLSESLEELPVPLEMTSSVVADGVADSSALSCAQASPPSATVPTTLAAVSPIVAVRIRAALL